MEQSLYFFAVAFVYINVSLIVGVMGGYRDCGWLMPMLISLLLTPIAGMFVVLASKDKKTEALEAAVLAYLERMAAPPKKEMSIQQTIAIRNLEKDLDADRITMADFKSRKDAILSL